MSSSRAAVFLLLWLMGLVYAAPGASAVSPRRFSLNLTRQHGAERCITSARMASMVEQLLGPVFGPPAEAELAVEVQLRAAETGGWAAIVTISDAGGEVLGRRELRSDERDCRAIDRPLLLVIAIAIDPELGRQPLPPQLLSEFDDGADPARELLEQLQSEPPQKRAPAAAAAPMAAPEVPARTVSQRSVAASPLQPAPARWQLRIGASAAVGRGVLPGWAAGVSLGIEVEPPHIWPLRLAVAYWPGTDAHGRASATGMAPMVRFAMTQGSLAVCPLRVAARPFTADACAGVLLAHYRTEQNALDQPRSAGGLTFAPLLRTQLAYEWSQLLASTLQLEAHAPLARDIFTYTDADRREYPLYRPAAFAIAAHLGFELRI